MSPNLERSKPTTIMENGTIDAQGQSTSQVFTKYWLHQMIGSHFCMGVAIATATIVSSFGWGLTTQRAIADDIALTPRLMNVGEHPVELDLLDPDADLSNRNVITNVMISQHELTLPSLWWTQSQFGGKLLENWLAYPGTNGELRRVDMFVDRQLWGLSTYLQRYTFVNQFGSAAKEFGYSLRVFNDRGEPLASYACNFPVSEGTDIEAVEADTSEHVNLSCAVRLDSSGAGAFRGRSTTFEFF